MLFKATLSLVIFNICVGVLGNSNGCPAPDHKPHSTFSPNKTFYDLDDVITYTCDSGYLRTSGSLQIKCIGYPALKVFTWTAEPPNCSLIDCGPLTIENGVVQQTVTSTIYGAEYKYICDSGYYPTNSTATCNAGSQWEYTPCRREPKCTKPILSSNLNINSTKLEYSVGEAIAFSCSDGFLLSGSPVSRCTLNEGKVAAWDGIRAGCVEGVKPTTKTEPPQSTLKSYAVPVAAGVTTAVVLTAVLIFILCCIHKRKLRKQSQSSQGDTMSNSDVSSHTCVLSNQRNTLARTSTSSQSTNSDIRASSVSPGFTSIHKLMDSGRSSSPQSVSIYGEQTHPHQCNTSPIPLISPSIRNSSCSGSFRQSGKPQYCCSHQATLDRQSSLPRQVSPYQHTCNALCNQCPPGHQPIPNNNNSNSNIGTPMSTPLGTPHRMPLSYERAAHEKDYHFYQPLEHIYEDPNLYLRQQQMQQLQHQPGQFFV